MKPSQSETQIIQGNFNDLTIRFLSSFGKNEEYSCFSEKKNIFPRNACTTLAFKKTSCILIL